MVKILSVKTAVSDPLLRRLLESYGFMFTKAKHSLAVIMPECPVRPGTLVRANVRPWTYFTTIVGLRRHYMNVYRDNSNTPWEYSEDAKQVTIAISTLSAVSYHMSEKIVCLLLAKSAKSAERGAIAGNIPPELRRHVSMLSYSPSPLDTCQEVVRMCNENYGGQSIKHPDALVNKHLDVYAKFSTVT